ncbi:phytoene desaturase family protein [Cytobacillus kochii]|uniref:4,4'-diaponeurosporene oxygenase n=1 Tax=Cytobacillus kochii TaxID=859143 RepID=A0A248TKJ9_9BACI|nr:phytoene desaturase family protein [Cytobacillus kochii]ASV68681.1 diapolycopene oxygenase [Cytobacillus kochii]
MKRTAIVIGGGLGGLSTSISLAQSGFQVSLYEKNAHLGGKLNRLEQDGFGFDLGPSILTMPHIFERLFNGSGKQMSEYIPIKEVAHQWRAFFPDGKMLDLFSNLEQMLTENDDLTSKDIEEYEQFLHYCKGLYEMTNEGYYKHGLDSTLEVIKHHGIIRSLRGFDLFSTMYDAIEHHISHHHLKRMLSYFIKYVGSSPYDAPAILNMMIYMQHKQGVWYVPGGMHKIAEGLTKLAQEIGVHIYHGQEVTKLSTSKNKVTEAILADGTTLKADYYISNMEVIPTYQFLLNENIGYINKLEKKFEPSSSGLVIHLGVKNQYPQLRHHNFFFSRDLKTHMNKIFHKKQLPDDPTIYLVNVNKTDPSQAPVGHENLKVLPHIPYIQDQPFTKEDYLHLRTTVLIKLEEMGLTNLRQSIVTEDFWTPEDIKEKYNSHRGSIYGTVSDKSKNKGFKHPKQSEKYKNLFFTGGTVNPGGGMPMVTLSGMQVRDKIMTAEKERA